MCRCCVQITFVDISSRRSRAAPVFLTLYIVDPVSALLAPPVPPEPLGWEEVGLNQGTSGSREVVARRGATMMENSDESVVYVLSSAGATSSGSHEAVTLSELGMI